MRLLIGKGNPCCFNNIFADAIVSNGNDDIIMYEFKSWSPDNVNVWGNFFSGKGNSYEQFLSYLSDKNLINLDNLHYVFNGQKADITQVKNGFKQLFTMKEDDIFNVIWDNQNLRSSLFGTNISKADAMLDFADYVKNVDNRLYKFIKSE